MPAKIIARGAQALGVSLPQGAAEAYVRYLHALERANRDFNLTSVEDVEEAATVHILDSLGVLGCIDLRGKSLIDVGTGGGLPGVALKIAVPEAELTLLDATEKKIRFLEEYLRGAGLEAACVCGRAEELGRDASYRERYDAAVSRAVAGLGMLAELCLPLVRPGGRFLAMKAGDSDEEIRGAQRAIETLGGRLEQVYEYTLPGTGILRRVAVVEKVRPTPAQYPRRWAAIKRSWL